MKFLHQKDASENYSGAVYLNVPTIALRPEVVLFSSRVRPKSPILILFSFVRNMFSGFVL